MRSVHFFLLSIIIATGCSSGSTTLPLALGVSGDLYVIADSSQWKGPLGEAVYSVFTAEMPGLPRKEAMFKVRWVDPRKMNFLIKQRRNLIFVMTLDKRTQGATIVQKLFTPASLEKINKDTSEFVKTSSNVFARGQEVMYLFGRDESGLRNKVLANAARLTDFFNETEKTRLTQSLLKGGQLKGVDDFLKKDFNCTISIPFGYKLADRKEDFVWLRQINPKDDKNIFIYRQVYSSQGAFKKENLIRRRNEACKKYLFEDPELSNSYLLTETTVPYIPVEADTINFNNHFAVRLRGLWRTNNFSMGGPFVGFALVDEGTQQIYYIEGFTFSPGKDQREIMRELETILYTFRTSTELKAAL